MGVTGLWKLIEPSGRPIPLETLENKVLAVDISIWLHQVIKGFQDEKGATLPNAHLLGLFHRLCKLLFYKIKPVFVFDGGVPALKYETMQKRQQNKKNYNVETEKLQQLLLQSLAKESIVKEAVGPSVSLLLASPAKINKLNRLTDDKDDMFKLPAIKDAESSSSTIGQNLTLTESETDSSIDEDTAPKHSNININSIDVTNKKFKSLPADIRHEILTDIKETRKQSSWGRIHELPVKSDDFSLYQMKHLIKRRQVQVSLEEAEKEMGGKSLSLADLECLLSEEGIVDNVQSKGAKRIASSENTYQFYINDLNDAKPKNEKIQKIEEINEDEKMQAEDYDEDLQAAIQMSLEQCDDSSNSVSKQQEPESWKDVRLIRQQKKLLREAAKSSSARAYMIEYAGMNSEDIENLVDFQETQDIVDLSFIYNEPLDDAINDKQLDLESSSKQLTAVDENPEVPEEMIDDHSSVSSTADSDFIDVPNMEDVANNSLPIIQTLDMNIAPSPDKSKDFRLSDLKKKPILEVCIDPNIVQSSDDLFADVFVAKHEQKSNETNEKKESIEVISKQNLEYQKEKLASFGVASTPTIESSPLPDLQKVRTDILKELENDLKQTLQTEIELNLNEIKTQNVELPKIGPNKTNEKDLKNILNDLDGNLKEVITLGTDIVDLTVDITNLSSASTSKSSEIIEILDDDNSEKLQKTPKKPMKQSDLNSYLQRSPMQKNTEPQTEESSVPKMPSPFFRKKTPTSKKKNNNTEDESQATKNPKVVRKLYEEDQQQTKTDAANILRETKTREELNNLAVQINEDKNTLEYEMNKLQRLGSSVSHRMREDCQKLLQLFGIPYIVAPQEAEAQCAFLNQCNLTDGTITDDSDIWLFGGKTVYKNFFNQDKTVMEFCAENIERYFSVNRDKLIQLSILVGSDYTAGVNGIGAVTALEILASFNTAQEKETDESTPEAVSLLSGLRKFREWWKNSRNSGSNLKLRNKLKNITLSEEFPSIRVVEAYLFPEVDSNRDKFAWGYPDAESIREFAKTNLAWTYSKTDDILLPVLKKLNDKKTQQTIQDYFKSQRRIFNMNIDVSKRVKRAIDKLHSHTETSDDDQAEKKKPRASTAESQGKNRRRKKANTKKETDESVAVRKTRTRKPKTNQIDADADAGPSNLVMAVKNPILPERNPEIPQRLKGIQQLEENKQKAIKLMKKDKTSKNAEKHK